MILRELINEVLYQTKYMTNRVGIFGLSTMGKNLALNFVDKGVTVSVFNRTPSVTYSFLKENQHPNLVGFENLNDFISSLERPRIILLLIKSEAVEVVLNELSKLLDSEDYVVDLGNSYFLDSRDRNQRYINKFNFVDCGISGGEEGARHGPSLVLGGSNFPAQVFDVLKLVSARFGDEFCLGYFEGDGAGHFVKMIHNAIEYAVMQSLTEIITLLFNLKEEQAEIIQKLRELEHRGMSSYLLGICINILEYDLENRILHRIVDEAGQKGTGKWCSQVSLDWGVGVPSITCAVEARQLSIYFNSLRSSPGIKVFNNSVLKPPSVEILYDVLNLCYLCFYDQALRLIAHANRNLGYKIDVSLVFKVWRAGCILAASHLNQLSQMFHNSNYSDLLSNMNLVERFSPSIQDKFRSLTHFVNCVSDSYSYAPVIFSVYNYLLGAFSNKRLGFSLIQAMRDFFGRHGVYLDGSGQLTNIEWKK